MHMTGDHASSITYRAEGNGDIIVETLDMITLVYQRRSGITHMVAEPMPQILAAFGDDALTIVELTKLLADQFELGDDSNDIVEVITARIQELETLGLVIASDQMPQDIADA